MTHAGISHGREVDRRSTAVIDDAGAERLKDRLEADLLETYAVGPRVVAVGGRAGRSALSLVRRGHEMTVVDASQIALDEVGSLAEGLVVDLKPGDARHLPAADEAYDSLLSLDCAAHVPDRSEILPEWVRVVKQGGRLVFDLPSLDGLSVADSVSASGGEAPGSRVGSGRPLASVRAVVVEADKLGLAIVDVVPYGLCLGAGGGGHPLAIAGKHWWRRLLSWLATDDRLLDFALFVEQELVGRLSGAVPGRHMVVFERRHDPAHNEAWLRARHELAAVLGDEIVLEALAPWLRLSTAEFRSRLNDHLRVSLRNFVFFDGLCRGLVLGAVRIDAASFLETDTLARCEDWSRRRHVDREVTSQARGWFAAPQVDESLRLHGVSVGDAFEYFLIDDLLARHHYPYLRNPR